jgi:hypothetical protein
MASGTYTPTGIVHHTSVDFTLRHVSEAVHLVQGDVSLPVIAVDMYADGQAYAVPSSATVNFRLNKKDGTYIYNPVLGVNSARTTAYIEVTEQTCAAAGEFSPEIEVVNGSDVAGSSKFKMIVEPNAIQEGMIESSSEGHALIEYASESRKWAEGRDLDGNDVPSSAEQYHNNAKYWANEANVTVAVGTTTTASDPTTPASVTNSGTSKDVVLNFVIPRGLQGEQGIQGIQGPQGIQGEPFEFYKVYVSVAAMEADAANVPEGKFVLINTNDVEDDDNSKMFVRNSEEPTGFRYLNDLSGAQGIQGPQGIQGVQGERGETGNGIASVTKTSTAVLVDTYTITFTDGTSTTFNVQNGRGIATVEKTGSSGLADAYTITFTDGTTQNYVVNNGNGIVSVTQTGGSHIAGQYDTYTITYTDGTTSTFQVYNGANGEGSGDMEKRIYDTNDDGIVDNAEALEGHGASHFATASELTTHAGNASHITAEERTLWNSYGDKLYSLPKFTTSLLSSGWTDQSGYYTQTVNVTGMTAEIMPAVSLVTAAGAKDDDLWEAFGHLYRVESAAGTLTFWADEEPTEDISLMGFMIKEAN